MSVQDTENVTVSQLLLHPIKSCGGLSVDEVEYTPKGIKYDRNWSIVDAEKNKVLTLRDIPKLALVHTQIAIDKDLSGEGTLTVSFPEDSGLDSFQVPLLPDETIFSRWQKIDSYTLFSNELEGYIAPHTSHPPPSSSILSSLSSFLQTAPTPSSLLSSFLDRSVHLVFKGPKRRPCDPTQSHPELVAEISQQDGYPILLLGEESVRWLEGQTRKYVGEQGVEEKWREEKLTIRRFRPNVVLKGTEPFVEDSWKEVIIENPNDQSRINANIALVSLCARCLLPNVDPETGIRDKAVPYKIMMKSRAGLSPEDMRSPCMGINGVPAGNGIIKVGDRVRVTKAGAGSAGEPERETGKETDTKVEPEGLQA